MKNGVRRRRTRFAAGLLLAAAVAVPLHAQQATGVGTIEGTITEANTGRFVEGAQVGVTGAGLGATTNCNGFYRITNVPARSIVLSVRQYEGSSRSSQT